MKISDILKIWKHTHKAGWVREEITHEYLCKLRVEKDVVGPISCEQDIYFFIAALFVRKWK